MQPAGGYERPAPMTNRSALRAALALLLALAALGAPTASIVACTCDSLGVSPADVAASAVTNGGIGFLGTVVGARPAARDPDRFGDVVAYAFEVERATAPVPATIEVHALNDPGGGACGFVFGAGEEWFVSALPDGSVLHTSLCSDNRRAADIDPAEMERLVEVLTEEPAPGGKDDDVRASNSTEWLSIGGVAAILVVFGGVMALAFRRRDVS
jgi:hypothetical protein